MLKIFKNHINEKTQYETSISGSVLSIKSKDPKLKSEKMYVRIKERAVIQFTQKLEVASLDEQRLIVYVEWSDHTKILILQE